MRSAPIIRMLCVSIGIAMLIVLIEVLFRSHPDSEILMARHPWPLADLLHVPQSLIPFLLILYITRGRPQSFGFDLREDSHLSHKRMLRIGIVLGLLMSFKYIPRSWPDDFSMDHRGRLRRDHVQRAHSNVSLEEP